MSSAAIIDNDEIRAAYREHIGRQLARSIVVSNGIAIIGMLSGITLDYFLYPQRFLEFVGIRFGVALILFSVSCVLVLQRARPRLAWTSGIGVLSLLVMTASFSLMIYLTDGERSPYFAGIILVLMAWTSLLPWTLGETLAMALGSLVIYAIACVASPGFAFPGSLPFFGFNTSFILITTIVCAGTSVFLSRVRFEDFRLRHQLDVQNRELQDLDRLKTQFFSNVSHELRTPLTLILGPVESLLGRPEPLDSKVHENLILVHRNTLRLLKLINDLLDLTRMDLGGEALRKKPLPLGAFVKGVVDSVRYLGLSKRLRMVVEEGSPPIEVMADPARLEKVLVNLLTNAIKYTPAGGTITVRWASAAAEASIEVQDTGVGIPKEDLPLVFDRFHQVRSNAANQNQGVGIGLALAKELAEAHGGSIDVESVVGTGTTFRIRLPFGEGLPQEPVDETESADADSAVDAEEEPFEKAFRSADRAVRSFTDELAEDLPEVGDGSEVILVADDENDMRQFLVSMLAEEYRVVQTPHGANVASLVAEHEPGLVLLDWMMPGKTGLEVCRELRANDAWKDMKIMLLTARVDEKSKIEALESGADDFLTKPFSSVEVKTRVANLLGSSRLQRDLRLRNADLQETLEKLQRTEAMLIQSEKMNAIGSLSAGLLHEINNPLNYTLTAISIVQQSRDAFDDDMKELIGDIEEGMGRIRDVITHLKNFAYPEKPGQQSEFPLAAAVRDAQKLAAKELLDVSVSCDFPEALHVRAQRTQLTHVFINLLTNAAKALAARPRGERREVTIRAGEEGGRVRIEVEDNGPGIPPDIIGRVFEPFFTTRDVGEGMGMGLSVCLTILEAHGGGIRVANRPEGGAHFTIELPSAELASLPC